MSQHTQELRTPFVLLTIIIECYEILNSRFALEHRYGTPNETVTQGITGLAERCQKYYKQGARFSKWRAVLRINKEGAPTPLAIKQNAETLARYGAISQACGLVRVFNISLEYEEYYCIAHSYR